MKKWAKTLIFLDGNIVCKDKCVNTIKKVKEKRERLNISCQKKYFLIQNLQKVDFKSVFYLAKVRLIYIYTYILRSLLCRCIFLQKCDSNIYIYIQAKVRSDRSETIALMPVALLQGIHSNHLFNYRTHTRIKNYYRCDCNPFSKFFSK